MDRFPRWLYRGAESVLVYDEAEEEALGGQWGDVPGYVNARMPGAVKPVPAAGREELLEQAAHRGIKVDRRWSASRILREMAQHGETP